MRMKIVLLGLFAFLILFPSIALASSPYGEMEVFYNERLLPGSETAKPTLKIGEPFKVSINLTVYQKSEVSLMLSEIGDGDFIILEGFTNNMNRYGSKVIEKNSSETFEWTVKPTNNWAGGSLPVNLVYQINDFETGDILVNSGFTIAYPYISNEYYEGETPTSEQPASENQLLSGQPASENSSASTTSAPAFSLITAISALVLVFLRFSRQ